MQIHVSPEINRLLDAATNISVRQGRYYVGCEHLLEAVIETSASLPPLFFERYAKNILSLQRAVNRDAWKGSPPGRGQVFFTPRCVQIAQGANQLARELKSEVAGPGHLLLALLMDPLSSPSRAAETIKLNREELIQALGDTLKKPDSSKIRGARPAAPVSMEKEESPKEPPHEKSATKEDDAARFLESVTRDLTALARQGRLDPAIGRDRVMMQVMEILTRRGKNNVILTGEAGVGKTKVVEGLALAAAKGTLGELLSNSRILELNVAALMAGTQYRGAFEEKLLTLLKEFESSTRDILFIDEIHLIMGAGATDGDSMDVANLLKPALARGELRCIGATTASEYRKFIQKDPAIERRFQMVRVEALSDDATYQVLKKLRTSLEKHHGVRVSKELLKAVIRLTNQYIPDRHQPDKSIDVLDQACARYRLKLIAQVEGLEYTRSPVSPDGDFSVTIHEIRRVISQMTALPVEDSISGQRTKLDRLGASLKARVVGQDAAIDRVSALIRKSKAGLSDPNRPQASILLAGPSGVGKTQLAKELARELFGTAKALLTFDMGEYIEEHGVSRLLGAPPGYVGSEEEGRLTGAVRTMPHAVILFDEIEKAHPRIYDIFLPILDEGRLKDSRGRDVSFKHSFIFMTSNVGANLVSQTDNGNLDQMMLRELKKQFRPEFLNRFDEIITFQHLLFEDVRVILKMSVDQVRKRLSQKGIGVRMYQGAYELLAGEGYSREMGARELKRVVERLVANPVSDLLIRGEFRRGEMIDVMEEDGALVFRKGRPHREKASRR